MTAPELPPQFRDPRRDHRDDGNPIQGVLVGLALMVILVLIVGWAVWLVVL